MCKDFFNLRHPSSYKLYNLCSEREYQPSKFEGRVSRYPFDDHNPCPLDVIEPFCKDVKAWLASSEHVAAIHCKAGKGRTGFLISCYLMYSGFSPNADHALRYFAVKRTRNSKGVTIPSQIRYVHYFEKLLQLRRENKLLPDRNPLILTTVTIHGIPKACRSANVDVWFQLTSKEAKFSSKGKIPAERRLAEDYLFFQGTGLSGLASLDGDVTLKFSNQTLGRQAAMFQCWFNTRMLAFEQTKENEDGEAITRLVLKKNELDKAIKDKSHKLYSDTMTLELIFRSAL